MCVLFNIDHHDGSKMLKEHQDLKITEQLNIEDYGNNIKSERSREHS